MTLYEKVLLLQSLIQELKSDTALALTIQGLYTEAEDITLKDIPDLILKIRVYDFNYKFDFKALESVGNIHTRLTGNSSGGMFINPVPFDLKIIDPLDMKTPTPIVPRESGVYGQPVPADFNCVFPEIKHIHLKFNLSDIEAEESRLGVSLDPYIIRAETAAANAAAAEQEVSEMRDNAEEITNSGVEE